MAFNISPQINVYERDFTLTLEMKGDTKGAQAGVTSWGPAFLPTLITNGEEGFRSKFWTPTNQNFLSYFIARDFLKYSNKMIFTRVNGPLARNSSSGGVIADCTCESSSVTVNDIQREVATGDVRYRMVVNGTIYTTVESSVGEITTFQGLTALYAMYEDFPLNFGTTETPGEISIDNRGVSCITVTMTGAWSQHNANDFDTTPDQLLNISLCGAS